MNFRYLDKITYQQGIEANQLATPNTILGMEHPKTISLGIRAKPDEDLAQADCASKVSGVTSAVDSLKSQGFDIQYSDRGGQATIHNPGQLVIYPKIDLREHDLGLKETVCKLLKATAKTLTHFGVEVETQESRPGLFTQKGKIAFIGLRIRQGIVHHGISINIKNDLTDFQAIRSCGIMGEAFDSLAKHDIHVHLEDVFKRFAKDFTAEFGLTHQEQNTKLCVLSKETMRV